jgi:hypothetical protein
MGGRGAMNPTSLETWKQQWTAFWSAPYIILPFIVASFLAAWWFRGKTKEGEIAGLERQISAKDERLELAKDQTAAVERDFEKLKKEFQAYKEEVAVKGRDASPAQVEAAIAKLADGNAMVRSNFLGSMYPPFILKSKEQIGNKSENWSIEWQQKELDKLKRAKDQKAQDH